jgi:hypothetical protein
VQPAAHVTPSELRIRTGRLTEPGARSNRTNTGREPSSRLGGRLAGIYTGITVSRFRTVGPRLW